jgi:hypothetical protein
MTTTDLILGTKLLAEIEELKEKLSLLRKFKNQKFNANYNYLRIGSDWKFDEDDCIHFKPTILMFQNQLEVDLEKRIKFLQIKFDNL